MEGITVIETVSTGSPSAFWLIWAFLALLTIAAAFAFASEPFLEKKECRFGLDIAGHFFLSACTLMMGCAILFLLYDGYERNKEAFIVAIDDSASFIEFTDRYEIIEELGDNEYIVIERNSES